MTDILNTIGLSAIVIFIYMTTLFIIAMLVKDNSIADIAWGIGFIIVAIVTLIHSGAYFPRQIVVTLLVLIWGSRLAIRIIRRNWGKGEDWRYQEWRKSWGKYFVIRSYLQVFILQGFILVLNVTPVIIINTTSDTSITALDVIGIALWGIGFFFESVGDYQLDRFIRNPENRGKIMDQGLWRYTRHPNYFGEITMWWGIWIIALSVSWGWIGIIGPAIITAMIVFVSGIPLTERDMAKNPGFPAYKERTSILIPLPPKKAR